MSVALLEAMAGGLPVVASDIPGNRELVRHGECGLLFESGNAGELRASLDTLLANANTRRSLARAGHERVARNYSLEKMIASYHNALQNLVEQQNLSKDRP
jgi:glycosyltransferase involved in cell wall biosynthesis